MTQSVVVSPSAGVLPISISATQKASSSPAKNTSKMAAPRLKLLVRRLPPGLTQTEFETQLGEEWMAGAGRVDWLHFKAGRISKE
jgi:regulator of nonsense transcripts 3